MVLRRGDATGVLRNLINETGADTVVWQLRSRKTTTSPPSSATSTLALAQADALAETVPRIVEDVAALWQRERPGRGYPRMSRKPGSKWSRKGKVAASS